MCRITGIAFSSQHFHAIDAMTDSLAHGGPDGWGVWQDDFVALGHRRLAIVELSDAGAQPMISHSGRYVITFNGEIYNFKTLRAELELLHYQFKGHSDTEVMLTAFEAWGIEPSLKKFNGMFAFGLWDRQEKKLYLARDRFGEKPLYYGWVGDSFIFASELKAFTKHPNWKPQINEESLSLYMRYSYIPAPYSIYKGIYKLESGKWFCVNKEEMKVSTYWSAVENALINYDKKLVLSDEEAIELLDEKLTQAVALRQMADVPLGAFLSGGIDSSTIVALMQKNSNIPVKTFTIGFKEVQYNEAIYAKEVAKHLKTEHTEVYLNKQDALDIIPQLPDMYDEPFADSSQIPTYLVSKIAREKITVCLSGDAGDELFGGYNRYLYAGNIAKKMAYTPFLIQKTLAHILLKVSPALWDIIYNRFIFKINSKFKVTNFGDKAHKVGGLLSSVHNKFELYQYIISQLRTQDNILLNDFNVTQDFSMLPKNLEYIAWMMLADTISYLPGDILTKVDRASMAVSLEARVPFLDPELYEFAWQLPLSMKIRQGQSKWILRQVLYKYVPKELIERPKMGFGMPIDRWLRNEMKAWADKLLSSQYIEKTGYFNPDAVKKMWEQHLSGKRNFSHQIWNILMFQLWFNRWME
jgi:asparagine synthase (glutamine-hydrolysing)